MNKKIKLLIMKAGGIICSTVETDTIDKFDYHHHFDAERTIDKIDYHHFDAEKFAELIIRECAKVIINGGYWSGGPVGPKRQCTPPEIAEMVKDVFGVKE